MHGRRQDDAPTGLDGMSLATVTGNVTDGFVATLSLAIAA
jgi:hypothetical protein